MPRTTDTLSKLTLVASDMAYAADNPAFAAFNSNLRFFPDTPAYPITPNFLIPEGYRVQRVFNDTATGFKAIAFTSITAESAVIVAFAGTDGRNALDWKQNTKFGWNQWSANRADVFAYLDGLRASNGISPYTGKIHFTGQSLGGGLAEYAAYQYLARVGDPAQRTALKDRVTVTTFNGFGSSQILEQELGKANYDPLMLANVSQAASYFVSNDLISRLGAGHSGVPQYQLDFRSRKLRSSGEPFFLDPIEGHRIETGFYDRLSATRGFDEARRNPASPLITTHLQPTAAFMGQLFKDGNLGPEATVGSLGAIPIWIAVGLGGTLRSPALEVREFGLAVVDSFERGGVFAAGGTTAAERAKGLLFHLMSDVGANFATILASVSPENVAKGIAKLYASATGSTGVGRSALSNAVSKSLGLNVELGSTSDFDLYRQARLAFAGMPGGELVAGDSAYLAGLTIDRNEYLQMVLSDAPDWLQKTEQYLLNAAVQTASSGQNVAKAFSEFIPGILALVTSATNDAAGTEQAKLVDFAQHVKQLTALIGGALARLPREVVAGGTSTLDLGANSLSYADFRDVRAVFDAAIANPIYSDIAESLQQVVSQLDSAGSLIVLAKGTGPNVYGTPGYVPEAASNPSSTLPKSGSEFYTASIPYPAGSKGVKARFRMSGGSVESLSVVDGATVTQLDASGEFEIFFASGQRQVSFAVFQNKNIPNGGTLTISATLLDSSGNPTHQTRNLGTLTLVAGALSEDMPVTTYTIAGDQSPPRPGVRDVYGNTFGGAPAPGRNDFLVGSPNNDLISGLGGADGVNGGLGDDHILGGEGHDYLAGEAGKDRLEGEAGQEIILGGLDDDLILGGADADSLLMGNEGDDRIYGGVQADEATVFNSDTVSALPGSEWMDGGEGKDRMIGSRHDNVMLGGAGEDMLAGGAGADTMYGDRDVVVTPPFPIQSGTTITLSVGVANVAGGNDFLHGGGGNDIMLGEVGADTLLGAAGDDELQGDSTVLAESLHGGDFLDGGTGNDRLFGQGGNDALYGGAGNDLLQGDDLGHAPGDDYLAGEDGNDDLIGGGGKDVLYGGAGDDSLAGDADNVPVAQQMADELYGGEGADLLQGNGGDDLLDGGAGVDNVFGGLGKDRILGGAGADMLIGDEGNSNPDGGDADSIDGGAGDDFLFGQGGDDVLIGGEGKDWIQAGTGNDQLSGGAGDDTLIGEAGADRLDGGAGDDELQGGDNLDILIGGAGDDRLFGDGGGDTLQGGAGKDRLQGGAGDDNGSGGEGDDILAGEDGADTLAGDEGNDELQGNADNDRLEGGSGDDTLFGHSGSDTLLGGIGADYLEGGTGNDYLAGGEGFDTYYWKFGDGTDTFVDDGANAVFFGQGIFPVGTVSLRIGSLMLDFGGGDAIHIEGFDPNDPLGSSSITEFHFFDGTVLTLEQLLAQGFDLEGTPEADVLEGTGLSDRINTYESDDIVIAKAGDDVVDAGDGADLVDAGEGADLVYGGEGADTLFGGEGADELYGDEGDDQLFGDEGNDTLDGGTGGDTMLGGLGDDVYLIDDALDVVAENADEGYDVLQASISATIADHIEELSLVGEDDLTGTGNALDNYIAGNSGGNLLLGLEGDDQLDGNSGDDVLDGGTGADVMFGGSGDDLFVVDSDDDAVVEEEDFYHREVEYDEFGNIASYGFLEYSGGYDVVESSVSFALDQWTEELVLTGSDAIDGTGNVEGNYIEGNDANNSLYGYRLNGQADVYPTGIPFLQQFSLARNAAEEMLADKANAATFRARYPWYLPQQVELGPDDEADAIFGWGGDDRLYGSLDHDWLVGGEGDDLLYGFAGADFMEGGEGDDTYVVSDYYEFSFGYLGGDSLSYSDYDSNGDELFELEDEGTDTVVSEIDFELGEHFENLTLVADTRAYDPAFDTHGLIPRSTHGAPHVGVGNEQDNVLTGHDFGVELHGDDGNDTLIGGAGDDYLSGGGGGWADLMIGGGGDDTYIVTDEVDVVQEAAGAGIDSVEVDFTYTLGANVENLYLQHNGDENDISGSQSVQERSTIWFKGRGRREADRNHRLAPEQPSVRLGKDRTVR